MEQVITIQKPSWEWVIKSVHVTNTCSKNADFPQIIWMGVLSLDCSSSRSNATTYSTEAELDSSNDVTLQRSIQRSEQSNSSTASLKCHGNRLLSRRSSWTKLWYSHIILAWFISCMHLHYSFYIFWSGLNTALLNKLQLRSVNHVECIFFTVERVFSISVVVSENILVSRYNSGRVAATLIRMKTKSFSWWV